MSGENEASSFLARAQEGMGTRFQSQASIEKANEQRDKDWQAAYARLGQEPPKEENNYVHDGRTLYERLELNKKLNEEEWDQKMKLGNQYRGLDAEETSFLNMRKEELRAKEQAIRDEEQKGLAEYRQALAARQAAATADPSDSTPGSSSSLAPSTSSPARTTIRKPTLPVKAGKKDVKSLMKGVVVKKKPVGNVKPSSGSGTASATGSAPASGAGTPMNGAGKSSGSSGGSGSVTPISNASASGRTLATANEMRNSQMVGKAGMTALGKRLVQDSPSPSPSPPPSPPPPARPRDTTTGPEPAIDAAEAKAIKGDEGSEERSEKRARIGS